VVSFANLTYANTGVINAQVLDTLITLAGLTPRVLPPSPVLQQRKDALVNLLPHWNNAQASGLFAENFFLDNPIDSLRKQASRSFYPSGRNQSRSPDGCPKTTCAAPLCWKAPTPAWKCFLP
jgi:hypothetical protein